VKVAALKKKKKAVTCLCHFGVDSRFECKDWRLTCDLWQNLFVKWKGSMDIKCSSQEPLRSAKSPIKRQSFNKVLWIVSQSKRTATARECITVTMHAVNRWCLVLFGPPRE